MIANYGYEDGSGYYYITIDGDHCATCGEHPCVEACPQDVFVVELDDYDDMVAVVTEAARRRLRELCAGCKALNGAKSRVRPVACVEACPTGAISHSW